MKTINNGTTAPMIPLQQLRLLLLMEEDDDDDDELGSLGASSHPQYDVAKS